MGTQRTWNGQVEPDYFQFYVRRASGQWAADQVCEDGYRDRLWSDGHFVYVGTLRKFGTTTVEVDVRDGPAPVPDSRWQHVAEVSLISGGPLEIFSWPGDEPEATIAVPEDPLRLRVAWGALVAGRFEGMDDDGNSDEHLALTVWPAALAEPAVLRRWDGWV